MTKVVNVSNSISGSAVSNICMGKALDSRFSLINEHELEGSLRKKIIFEREEVM